MIRLAHPGGRGCSRNTDGIEKLLPADGYCVAVARDEREELRVLSESA